MQFTLIDVNLGILRVEIGETKWESLTGCFLLSELSKNVKRSSFFSCHNNSLEIEKILIYFFLY